MQATSDSHFFGTEKIGKILLKIAPPVMLAQLIQALYNIVDSFFVGSFSNEALTALTVIFPLQLIIVALAVGTGVGVNTYMARKYAQNKVSDANKTAGTGMLLSLITWALFSIIAVVVMRPYVMASAKSPAAVEYAIVYGNIVSVGSIGAFLEGNWTKVHQAKGNMRLPMVAQIIGALVNIVFDPLLIFGYGFFPKMGVAGAALATVLGQCVAAAIVAYKAVCKPPRLKELPHYIKRIYFYGYSSILMQGLYTVYIAALNMILAGFSDAAVTVLGLYYKLQTFFFIPLFGLQTCIVPVLSYNYTRSSFKRCKSIMKNSFVISGAFMLVGTACFLLCPAQMAGLFSSDVQVISISKIAFPIIGSGFVSASFALMMPVFFQAIGDGKKSAFLSLARQIFLLLPVFWLLSLIGMNYTWLAFPICETASGALGLVMYARCVKKWNCGA